jgi:hypothetical protein
LAVKRLLKVVAFLVVGGVALVACVIVAILVYIDWPRHASASVVRARVATSLADNADGAVCHQPKTFRLVHPDYKTPDDFNGRYGSNPDTSRAPFPKVTLHEWSKTDKGTGKAHVEGKVAGWDDMRLVSPAPCVADVSFDYDCGWQDNGRSARWDCIISNVRAY